MDFLTDWLSASGGGWFYLIIFISALLENLFTPLPGDTVTVFGAYLAGRSGSSLIGVYTASTLGGVIGFMGLYLFGKLLFRRGEKRDRIFRIKMETLEKVGIYFRRWGYLVILFNRFLYGLRFAVAIFAGLWRLPWQKTLFFALLSTCLWNIVLVSAGGTLGENWESFKSILWEYNRFIFAALIIILAAAVLIFSTKARKNNT